MEYLPYSEFEKEIKRMAVSATETSRLRFARDTIRLLHEEIAPVITLELMEAERDMLERILAGIKRDSFGELRALFEEFHDSVGRDQERAMDFDPDLIELLCAIDNLLHYAVAQDPQFIVRIAINRVNGIDHALSGLPENIVAAPEMRAELERAKELLAGA